MTDRLDQIQQRLKRSEPPGIKCPTCKAVEQALVIDSRPHAKGRRRRRECLLCGTRFNAIEVVIKNRTAAKALSVLLDAL